MKRWLIPLLAISSLVFAQPVLAAQPQQGVVRDFVNPPPAGCEHPEGIAASPNGLIYASGVTGNICVYTRDGSLSRIIPIAAGHALLGELYVSGEGLYVADNQPNFAGGSVIRVDPASGAVTTLATGFRNTNAITQDHRGMLYVSDSFANAAGEGEIYRVSPNGGRTLWAHSPLLAPHGFPGFGANGVAFDRTESYLYVANTSDDRVLRIAVNDDGSAGAVTIFADAATVRNTAGSPAPLDGPDGIQFDVRGNLWICANQPAADEIQVLSPSAELIARYGRNPGDAPMQTPASLIFHERAMYIANLAFFDPGVGKISVLGVPTPGAPIAH
jgi:sugar lactone lactonase YvrE